MVDKFPCWQMEWCFPWKCQFSAIQPLTRKKAEKTPKISQTPQKIHPKKSSPNLRNWNRKRKKMATTFFQHFWTSSSESAMNSALPYPFVKSPPSQKKKQSTKLGSGFGTPDSQNSLFESSNPPPIFLAPKKFGGSQKYHPLFWVGFFPEISWFLQMVQQSQPHLQVKNSPTPLNPKKTQESLKTSLKALLFPAGFHGPWGSPTTGIFRIFLGIGRWSTQRGVLFTGATNVVAEAWFPTSGNRTQNKQNRLDFYSNIKKLSGTGVFQKKQDSYRIQVLEKKMCEALWRSKLQQKELVFFGFWRCPCRGCWWENMRHAALPPSQEWH